LAILSGCGGSGGFDTRVVRGDGFTFQAPVGWEVGRAQRTVTVNHGADVVQVRRSPLARTYTPELFDRVQPEIERVAKQLAGQLGVKLTGPRVLEVAGERAWQFDYAHEGFQEQLTFVLRGNVEFQLYCRRAVNGDGGPCHRLVESFALS
jgi:hypothetical protein